MIFTVAGFQECNIKEMDISPASFLSLQKKSDKIYLQNSSLCCDKYTGYNGLKLITILETIFVRIRSRLR